jgi:SAM-dependent methyltransferase
MRKTLVSRTPKRTGLILLVAMGAAMLYRNRHRTSLEGIRANVRAFDLPSAGLYDALVASLLGGLYGRVADEVAEAYPTGTVLEVGSGPGRLAVQLARKAPDLAVTGVDISPEMVERASRRAEEAGLGERVRFEVGDVGALSFPEGSFDGALSTLSLHHWPEPARGLAEIHRVLKPGGEALIYDLAHWLWLPAHGGSQLDQLAAESPFVSGAVELVRWPASVPAFVRLRLRLGESSQVSS